MLAACTNPAESEAPPTEIIVTIEPTNIVTDHTPIPTPAYLPQPDDRKLTRAKAFTNSVDLLTIESNPIQIELLISGHLPTPCHELRVKIEPPDEENNIHVEVYSVANPEMICAQVLRAFTERIALGSYPAGSYIIWVNGNPVGNFDS